MKKRIGLFFIALVVCSTVNFKIVKAEKQPTIALEYQIMPLYEDTKSVDITLKVSGKTATCITIVSAKRKSDISVKMKLQKKDNDGWETVKTWEESKENSLSFQLSKKYNVLSGTYRIVSIVRSGSDRITKTSLIKTVS